VIAVDSGVVIAGFASWHERHGDARRILDEEPSLVAHAALESYSVLTRLPPPHRAPANLVAEFLQASFPRPYLCLPDEHYSDLARRLAEADITGGASYDALIAATAAEHGATLVSLDARAYRTYQAIGAPCRLV
jgi:predicted nucleic acid-binding protein